MLNIISALDCEARPLVAHLRLRRRADCHAFALFERDDLRLLVSGTGKLAAAAATAYAAQLPVNPDNNIQHATTFLNVGLAGHTTAPIGSGLVAHAVVDAGSGRRWYPAQLVKLPCPTTSITTFDTPNYDYSQPGGYDMELSGVLTSALHWTTLERVQAFKVVADNGATPNQGISAKTASMLIEKQMAAIEHMITQMQALQQNTAATDNPVWYKQLNSRYRLSTYQQLALKKLLIKARHLEDAGRRIENIARTASNGTQLLKMLRSELQETRLSFPD